jgi:integrase
MMANGSAAGTARQAHQTIRTALGEAVRRGTSPGILPRWPSRPACRVPIYSPERGTGDSTTLGIPPPPCS